MTPETRLLTADLHWEPVGKLAVGDELLALDEEQPYPAHRRWRRSVIEETVEVVRPCSRVTLEDGTSVVCPEECRWLAHHKVARRWLQASQMKAGDRLVRASPVWELAVSREAGYLAAAFDGEGSLRQNPVKVRGKKKIAATAFGLGFTQKDNAMLAETRRCLDALGFPFSDINHDGDRGQRRLVISRRIEVLRFLGQIRPVRLLALFDPDGVGAAYISDLVRVTAKEDVGSQPVIALRTSTRTCVADGFAAHDRSAVQGVLP